MKTVTLAILLGALIFTASFSGCTDSKSKLTPEEAKQLAREVYIYAYPLVTMEYTKRVMTNVAEPLSKLAPINQFAKLRSYPKPEDKEVTAPNADTYYTLAWLDVSKEPYILSVPDFKGRYFLLPMLSGWTDVFEVPGSRTSGTDAAVYAITGPKWNGTLPQGVKQLKSPTSLVWILGRIYCTGTEEDSKEVHALQDKMSLVPLSSFGKDFKAPAGTPDPKIDMKTPIRDQVHNLPLQEYFNMFAKLLTDNPPAAEDAPMVEKMHKLGIVAGEEFKTDKFSPEVISALKDVAKSTQSEIMGYLSKTSTVNNGWSYISKTGIYGTDYMLRALVTAVGLGANRQEDAIYPLTEKDEKGDKLNGANKYTIHFDKGQVPPVKGFWSLTMYDDKYFFIANPLNRYTLSSRFDFKYNEDGSLDFYIQKDSPGKDKEANWLPAPAGDFVLMFRFYWPDETIIKGKWKMPFVKKM